MSEMSLILKYDEYGGGRIKKVDIRCCQMAWWKANLLMSMMRPDTQAQPNNSSKKINPMTHEIYGGWADKKPNLGYHQIAELEGILPR